MISLLFSTLALACSPLPHPPPPFSEQIKEVDYIYVAEATGPEVDGFIPINILHSFKGEAGGKAKYYQLANGTCGYKLAEGDTFLVLGWKDKEGIFSSNTFSGTKEITFAEPSLFELLKKKGKAPELKDAKSCNHPGKVAETRDCAQKERARLAKKYSLDWLKP